MPTFYKVRGTELATVIYDDDIFYDFVRTEPDLFEYQTTNPKAIKFLTEAGYPTKEELPPIPGVVESPAPAQETGLATKVKIPSK